MRYKVVNHYTSFGYSTYCYILFRHVSETSSSWPSAEKPCAYLRVTFYLMVNWTLQTFYSSNSPSAFRFVSIFFRVTKQMDKIIYFSNGDWKIHCPETMRVVDRMNYHDKELFYCDIRSLNWTEYIFTLWRGMRLFILQEDLDSKAGRRKYVQLWYMHYGLLTICFATICYYGMKIFGYLIWSLKKVYKYCNLFLNLWRCVKIVCNYAFSCNSKIAILWDLKVRKCDDIRRYTIPGRFKKYEKLIRCSICYKIQYYINREI